MINHTLYSIKYPALSSIKELFRRSTINNYCIFWYSRVLFSLLKHVSLLRTIVRLFSEVTRVHPINWICKKCFYFYFYCYFFHVTCVIDYTRDRSKDRRRIEDTINWTIRERRPSIFCKCKVVLNTLKSRNFGGNLIWWIVKIIT